MSEFYENYGDLTFFLPIQTLINLRCNNYFISGTHHWGGHGRFLAIHPNEDFNLDVYYEQKTLHDSAFVTLLKKVDKERKRLIEMLHNNGNQNVNDLKTWVSKIQKKPAGHMLMTRKNGAPCNFDVPFMEAKNWWKNEVNKRMYLNVARQNTMAAQNKKRKIDAGNENPNTVQAQVLSVKIVS